MSAINLPKGGCFFFSTGLGFVNWWGSARIACGLDLKGNLIFSHFFFLSFFNIYYSQRIYFNLYKFNNSWIFQTSRKNVSYNMFFFCYSRSVTLKKRGLVANCDRSRSHKGQTLYFTVIIYLTKFSWKIFTPAIEKQCLWGEKKPRYKIFEAVKDLTQLLLNKSFNN
jgi:hypothetical protein